MQSDINAIYVIFTLEIHFVYFWSNTEYNYWEVKKLSTAAAAIWGALLCSRRQLTRLERLIFFAEKEFFQPPGAQMQFTGSKIQYS
jgi:hypothetical protein